MVNDSFMAQNQQSCGEGVQRSQVAGDAAVVAGGSVDGAAMGLADASTDKPLNPTQSKCMDASPEQHVATLLRSQLKGPRKCLRNRRSLSTGEWRTLGVEFGHCGLVYLTQQKGKHWSVHGHSHQGNVVLMPEEALFLMECGVLEVYCSGKVWGVQEAYQCLLSGVQLQIYQVYASLKRIGFIANRVCLLRRHSGELLTKGVDSHLVTVSVCNLCCNQTEATATAQRVADMLEVYKPPGAHATPYKKTVYQPPHFRVLVARLDDEFPSGDTLKLLCGLQPPAPLRMCVVDGGNLAYYTIHSPKT